MKRIYLFAIFLALAGLLVWLLVPRISYTTVHGTLPPGMKLEIRTNYQFRPRPPRLSREGPGPRSPRPHTESAVKAVADSDGKYSLQVETDYESPLDGPKLTVITVYLSDARNDRPYFYSANPLSRMRALLQLRKPESVATLAATSTDTSAASSATLSCSPDYMCTAKESPNVIAIPSSGFVLSSAGMAPGPPELKIVIPRRDSSFELNIVAIR